MGEIVWRENLEIINQTWDIRILE